MLLSAYRHVSTSTRQHISIILQSQAFHNHTISPYLWRMLDKPPIELSDDYRYALDLLEKHNTSMFITGKAGTGKSTLLQLFRNTTKKRVVVLAPTGIAALNVQGQTIHSFFGFPPKPLTKKDITPRRYKKLYKRIDTIIIDEISMVRADMMDNIDYFLRINCENPAPFGGKQVIFFGDLFQLPPIVKNEEQMYFSLQYDSPYFFSAMVFNDFHLEPFELRKVYRQDNIHFIKLLDRVRTNRIDWDDIETLNERYMPEDFETDDSYITLSTVNRIVNQLNSRKLRELNTLEMTYIGKVEGNFSERTFPTDLDLRLRVGAQVMFVKNDPERQFVNGTLGKIEELAPDKIKVMLTEDGKQKVIEVEKTTWEILKYRMNDKNEINTEPVGSFTQYPLRLAWAVTIHKSQGKTFDRVVIDLGRGAFAHGQTYVALSRCRTFEGILLKQKIKPQDVMLDERIVQYYEQFIAR